MCKKNCAGKKQTILTSTTTVWFCTRLNILNNVFQQQYNIYPGWMLNFGMFLVKLLS